MNNREKRPPPAQLRRVLRDHHLGIGPAHRRDPAAIGGAELALSLVRLGASVAIDTVHVQHVSLSR